MAETYIIGYIEIPEDYWVYSSTINIDDPNKYWHGDDDE
tara:strand:- start:455 stop:571 length:117 start_codon:yes stop_codon:yes gene_type:complete